MTPTEPEVMSVAELDRRLKRVVEGASADLWVEGEVSGARPASSGHLYFVLKDEKEDAMIDCVLYRSTSPRARQLVQDGARIQVRGRATVWAPRGRLQLVAEQARAAGRGALLEALEKLKERLAAEGLFREERKRALPAEAAIIGVVTSASGAVIHDIAKVAFRRGGARILLAPSLVQGAGAARSIVDAIDRLERVREVGVIIVGRGGGSADDLMVWNDEAVVRRVAAARVPVVSAVGHETDVTLVDLAADARAATPSQAAELLVPDRVARAHALEQLSVRLRRAMRARLVEDRGALEALRARTNGFRFTLAEAQQDLDDRRSRLARVVAKLLARRRAEHDRWQRALALRHPRAIVADARGRLGPLEVRLASAARARVEASSRALATRVAGLDAMSPLAVLSRGYAIATRDDGHAVRDASEVASGDRLRVRVHRGAIVARVESTEREDA